MSEATPAVGAGGMDVLLERRSCIGCGYDLVGLPVGGVCPECGRPVADSLRGILLQFASKEYIGAALQGHTLVLGGILLYLAVQVAGIVARALVVEAWVDWGLQGCGIVSVLMIAGGYLRLTVRDPQFTGTERPGSARRVLQIAVMGQIAAMAATLTGVLLLASGGTGAAWMVVIVVVLFVVDKVLWAVQFFAMMRYTRWLARRVPDGWVVKRTKVYMWLLPVLATVGIVIMVGPLIALVMYWNLLDRMRKHLKAIQATGKPGVMKGMVG
ncbi:MAG: hypothetical protein KF745_13815 [Phycisphaeraceae bacterium]|nr:hypothetical protein [Phycisphaeraceae bacterium]